MDTDALARLKRLAGKSTLILTQYGRKSGKARKLLTTIDLMRNRTGAFEVTLLA